MQKFFGLGFWNQTVLPDEGLITLLPSERISSVKYIPIVLPPEKLNAYEELRLLTEAPDIASIGIDHASIASIAPDEVKHIDHFHIYETLFGRDSLRVAIALCTIYPHLLKTTILTLAKLQGISYSRKRQEEPGKILHEDRQIASDKFAWRLILKNNWQFPYYGSIDATILYIVAIGKLVRTQGIEVFAEKYIGRDKQEHTLAESFEKALWWLKTKMQENKEGLIEFKALFMGSLENEAWKDSWDSYHNSEGKMLNHKKGIASIEVQSLAYEAYIEAAYIYKQQHNIEKAEGSLKLAKKVKQNILQYFWIADEKYLALATDRDNAGNIRHAKIRTSNMGHVLATDILDKDKYEAIIEHLFSPAMLHIAGIRTLASTEKRYRAGSYHNGSVWIWDTGHIALDLLDHGYVLLANELYNRIKRIVEETHCYPEFVRADSKTDIQLNTNFIEIWDSANKRFNTIEQPPQPVQGWSVSVYIALEQKLKEHHTIDQQKRIFELSILQSQRVSILKEQSSQAKHSAKPTELYTE